MFRYLNWEEDCLFKECRRKKNQKKQEIIPKIELRSQDYKKLGLTPGKNFCCAKHFTHESCHLANQVDFVIENGCLSDGAFLKKNFSHCGFKKSVLLRASQFAAELDIGNEVIIELANQTEDVPIENISFIENCQKEKPKRKKTKSNFTPFINEHDYLNSGKKLRIQSENLEDPKTSTTLLHPTTSSAPKTEILKNDSNDTQMDYDENLNYEDDTHEIIQHQMTTLKHRKTKTIKIRKLKKVNFKKPKCNCNKPQKITGSFQKTGPYTQIGAFPTLALLKEHFYEIHKDYPQNSIKFQLVIFVDNLSPSTFTNYCKPYNNIYQREENELVTIFYKKNETSCTNHIWTVLAVHDFCSLITHPEIEELRDILLNQLPKMAHFEPNKRTNDNIDCDCNGNDHNNPMGANFHSGCHQGAGHYTLCKFFRHSSEQTICARFKLTKSEHATSKPMNNDLLQKTTHKIVDDFLTPVLIKWAKNAAENMEKHLSKAKECQIGLKSETKKCFTCLALNFDFCSHIHRDRNDLETGVTALLSMDLTDTPQQVHFYPTYILPDSPNPGPGFGFYVGNKGVVIEVSSLETHGASRVLFPNKEKPNHVSVVAFCARVCDLPKHGYSQKRPMSWYKRFNISKTLKSTEISKASTKKR